MSFHLEMRPIGRLIAAAALCALFAGHALAQSVRKECSEKYQAAKAAGTLNGLAWPQFYSQCAAQAKAGGAPPAAAAPSAPAAPAAPANPLKPAPTAAARAPAASDPSAPAPSAPAAGPAVFPAAISAGYAKETPGKARMKTCLDQYKANKETGGNGGLKWIQRGGGYYSQCNARLKG